MNGLASALRVLQPALAAGAAEDSNAKAAADALFIEFANGNKVMLAQAGLLGPGPALASAVPDNTGPALASAVPDNTDPALASAVPDAVDPAAVLQAMERVLTDMIPDLVEFGTINMPAAKRLRNNLIDAGFSKDDVKNHFQAICDTANAKIIEHKLAVQLHFAVKEAKMHRSYAQAKGKLDEPTVLQARPREPAPAPARVPVKAITDGMRAAIHGRGLPGVEELCNEHGWPQRFSPLVLAALEATLAQTQARTEFDAAKRLLQEREDAAARATMAVYNAATPQAELAVKAALEKKLQDLHASFKESDVYAKKVKELELYVNMETHCPHAVAKPEVAALFTKVKSWLASEDLQKADFEKYEADCKAELRAVNNALAGFPAMDVLQQLIPPLANAARRSYGERPPAAPAVSRKRPAASAVAVKSGRPDSPVPLKEGAGDAIKAYVAEQVGKYGWTLGPSSITHVNCMCTNECSKVDEAPHGMCTQLKLLYVVVDANGSFNKDMSGISTVSTNRESMSNGPFVSDAFTTIKSRTLLNGQERITNYWCHTISDVGGGGGGDVNSREHKVIVLVAEACESKDVLKPWLPLMSSSANCVVSDKRGARITKGSCMALYGLLGFNPARDFVDVKTKNGTVVRTVPTGFWYADPNAGARSVRCKTK
jgi:hypothetical protein